MSSHRQAGAGGHENSLFHFHGLDFFVALFGFLLALPRSFDNYLMLRGFFLPKGADAAKEASGIVCCKRVRMCFGYLSLYYKLSLTLRRCGLHFFQSFDTLFPFPLDAIFDFLLFPGTLQKHLFCRHALLPLLFLLFLHQLFVSFLLCRELLFCLLPYACTFGLEIRKLLGVPFCTRCL